MTMGALALTMSSVQAAVDEDKFTQLPGFDNPMKTNSYSGYLNVSETKALHYVFVESQNDPTNDPVVIWFNGGPGCSSLLGFFQENGPNTVDPEHTPTHQENEYSWNKNANMLYIESPAGVGYSIWKDANLTTNDSIQSEDAIKALHYWYSKYPEYKPNKLFVSGESYGGIYVPYLSWQIFMFNNDTTTAAEDKINLVGFLVGNGATNWDFDSTPSFPDTTYNFQLIPKHLLDFMKDNNCTYYLNDFRNHSGPATCDPVWEKIQKLTSSLNWYDLYRVDQSALLLNGQDRYKTTMVDGQLKRYKRGKTMAEYTPWLKHWFSDDKVSNDILADYVNSQEVRDALHIPADVQAWDECWDETHTYTFADKASQWIYPIMKKAGIKMVFYSGDTDGAVPTWGTKQWIAQLNWNTTEEWRPWTTDGQVTGYIEKYEGLDFVTVKGVGHMAPQWAPKAVQQFFNRWITDQAI